MIAMIDAAAERVFTRVRGEMDKLPANCPVIREMKGFKMAMVAVATIVAAVVSVAGLIIRASTT